VRLAQLKVTSAARLTSRLGNLRTRLGKSRHLGAGHKTIYRAIATPKREVANGMKLRHAAALALVGWYMIIPPTSRDYPMGNVDAPLSEWVKRPTLYRDKEECEHVLDRQTRLRNARNRQLLVRFKRQWQCVASDDPRLSK